MRGYIKNRIYYKHEKESGKLRIGGGSWSINLDEVTLSDVDSFIYKTEYADYIIDRDLVLRKGFSRLFGGENKFVIPIKWWDVKPHNPDKKVVEEKPPEDKGEKQMEISL